MNQLSEIDSQPLSMVVCNHLICRTCGIIDRDRGRLSKGHRCSTCNAEGDGGVAVFSVNIWVLVDLLQQAFHSQSPTGPLDAPQGNSVGTILYFCTLREALLNTFLLGNLRARHVPAPLVEKLMEDNKLASQKFGGLFTSVVGTKWEVAVSTVSASTGSDFQSVSQRMRTAAELRNEFLHEGRAWGMTYEFAKECVDSVGGLVRLFVALNNEYTHPILRNATQLG